MSATLTQSLLAASGTLVGSPQHGEVGSHGDEHKTAAFIQAAGAVGAFGPALEYLAKIINAIPESDLRANGLLLGRFLELCAKFDVFHLELSHLSLDLRELQHEVRERESQLRVLEFVTRAADLFVGIDRASKAAENLHGVPSLVMALLNESRRQDPQRSEELYKQAMLLTSAYAMALSEGGAA